MKLWELELVLRDWFSLYRASIACWAWPCRMQEGD